MRSCDLTQFPNSVSAPMCTKTCRFQLLKNTFNLAAVHHLPSYKYKSPYYGGKHNINVVRILFQMNKKACYMQKWMNHECTHLMPLNFRKRRKSRMNTRMISQMRKRRKTPRGARGAREARNPRARGVKQTSRDKTIRMNLVRKLYDFELEH